MVSDYIIPDWPAPAHVRAYTTTRQGGCSKAPFDSFNLATHVGDVEQTVLRNRAQLRSDLRLPNEPVWLEQVHGDTVIELEQQAKQPKEPTADACFTRAPNNVCVVMTGDCLPILLCSTAGTWVAAIHASWRCLAADIIARTCQHWAGSNAELLAWFGPGISQVAYEVGPEVRDAFVHLDPQHAEAFSAGHNDRWQADLYTLARQQLSSLGLTQQFGGNFCTFNEQKRFYSYRREAQTGRMASLIWLANE